MPTLDTHQSSDYTKILYIGDSSTGKTGSLVSLLADGYHFKILDMDNGLDSLIYYGKELGCNLGNVEYETVRDEYKSSKAGPRLKNGAKAFVTALDFMTTWSEIEDPNAVFVLDSLSAMGKAAFEWAKGMNPTAKDPRQWYFTAQQAVENVIAMVTGAGFKMNVIIIT